MKNEKKNAQHKKNLSIYLPTIGKIQNLNPEKIKQK